MFSTKRFISLFLILLVTVSANNLKSTPETKSNGFHSVLRLIFPNIFGHVGNSNSVPEENNLVKIDEEERQADFIPFVANIVEPSPSFSSSVSPSPISSSPVPTSPIPSSPIPASPAASSPAASSPASSLPPSITPTLTSSITPSPIGSSPAASSSASPSLELPSPIPPSSTSSPSVSSTPSSNPSQCSFPIQGRRFTRTTRAQRIREKFSFKGGLVRFTYKLTIDEGSSNIKVRVKANAGLRIARVAINLFIPPINLKKKKQLGSIIKYESQDIAGRRGHVEVFDLTNFAIPRGRRNCCGAFAQVGIFVKTCRGSSNASKNCGFKLISLPLRIRCQRTF